MAYLLPIRYHVAGRETPGETRAADFGDHVFCLATTLTDLGVSLRNVYEYEHGRDLIQVLGGVGFRGDRRRRAFRELLTDPLGVDLERINGAPRSRCLYDHLEQLIGLVASATPGVPPLRLDGIGECVDRLHGVTLRHE